MAAGKHKYEKVFSPLKVGNLTLRNRTIFPAFQFNYATKEGEPSERLIGVYEGLARGGNALIFTGCATVSRESVGFDRVLRIYDDKFIKGFARLFKAIESAGAIPAVQLIHYGRQTAKSVTGYTLVAPSAIPCPVMSQFDPQYEVREMTLEDIKQLKDDYLKAARIAKAAGAKMVEVHCAHGYLLNEFLSPYSNKRTDAYGGPVQNRARIVIEIIEGIKKTLPGLNIAVRISADEHVTGGLVPIDFKEIAPMFEKAGADMLNVAAGVYEAMNWICPPADMGTAINAAAAAAVKQYVSIPVAVVGAIRDLATAEAILEKGQADLICMARAQVADPEIIKKSFEGREKEINECLACNSCTFWTTGAPDVACPVNASL